VDEIGERNLELARQRSSELMLVDSERLEEDIPEATTSVALLAKRAGEILRFDERSSEEKISKQRALRGHPVVNLSVEELLVKRVGGRTSSDP
jgi:hypothetical protein